MFVSLVYTVSIVSMVFVVGCAPAVIAHTQVKVVAEVGVHEGLVAVIAQQVVGLHHRCCNHKPDTYMSVCLFVRK